MLFINPEHSIAHLFNATHVCWAGVLEVMTLLFAIKGLMLGWTSYLYGGALIVLFLLFTLDVMLADVVGGPNSRTVMVMLLLFAYMFALKIMLDSFVSSQESGIVVVLPLLFAIIDIMLDG
jgi:hypothetical protein